jgi:hypothetical protein
MPSTRPLQWIEQAEARQVMTDALFRQAATSSRRLRLRKPIMERLQNLRRQVSSYVSPEWPMMQAQPVLVRREDHHHPPVRRDDRYR